MCRATCHAVTGEANPSGEMPNISLTEAGTAVVVRADAKLGWRLTTAEYGCLKNFHGEQAVKASAVHMEHKARLVSARPTC